MFFVTSVGWDVGDTESGDVVQPESSFSSFQQISFEISRAMTSPVRWFRFGDSTAAAVVGVSLLSLSWGFVGYLPLALFARTVQRRFQKVHP